MEFVRTIEAKPTDYRGTVYRSRLEATWAMWFDRLGWEHAYEPICMRKWKPDFIIKGAHNCEVYVEVKPFTKYSQFVDHDVVHNVYRALNSYEAHFYDPLHSLLFLGENPFIDEEGFYSIGWLPNKSPSNYSRHTKAANLLHLPRLGADRPLVCDSFSSEWDIASVTEYRRSELTQYNIKNITKAAICSAFSGDEMIIEKLQSLWRECRRTISKRPVCEAPPRLTFSFETPPAVQPNNSSFLGTRTQDVEDLKPTKKAKKEGKKKMTFSPKNETASKVTNISSKTTEPPSANNKTAYELEEERKLLEAKLRENAKAHQAAVQFELSEKNYLEVLICKHPDTAREILAGINTEPVIEPVADIDENMEQEENYRECPHQHRKQQENATLQFVSKIKNLIDPVIGTVRMTASEIIEELIEMDLPHPSWSEIETYIESLPTIESIAGVDGHARAKDDGDGCKRVYKVIVNTHSVKPLRDVLSYCRKEGLTGPRKKLGTKGLTFNEALQIMKKSKYAKDYEEKELRMALNRIIQKVDKRTGQSLNGSYIKADKLSNGKVLFKASAP